MKTNLYHETGVLSRMEWIGNQLKYNTVMHYSQTDEKGNRVISLPEIILERSSRYRKRRGSINPSF